MNKTTTTPEWENIDPRAATELILNLFGLTAEWDEAEEGDGVDENQGKEE